jgi:uncharacterized protein YxjI
MKTFYIKQKAISFGDKYKIMDENQEVVYYCKGKVFSISHKMDFIRAKDEKLIYHFQKRIFSFLPTYYMQDENAMDIATVRKQWTVFSKKLTIDSNLGDFEVEGTFWAHSFDVLKNGNITASIKKKLISWGDTYAITIHDTKDTEFLLGLVILIDSIFHNESNQSRHRF